MQATKEQIAQWKAAHGDIFQLDVDGRTAYLKSPDRKTLSYAGSVGKSDPMKFGEVVLKNCWIDGDREIMTNDVLFISAMQKINMLIEIKEATMVKL